MLCKSHIMKCLKVCIYVSYIIWIAETFFYVVGLVFRHLSCICVPFGALESKSQQEKYVALSLHHSASLNSLSFPVGKVRPIGEKKRNSSVHTSQTRGENVPLFTDLFYMSLEHCYRHFYRISLISVVIKSQYNVTFLRS